MSESWGQADERLRIVASGSEWVVCVKPVGADSESDMPALLSREVGGEIYPVHRLDRNVAGLMVYARTKSAAAELSRLIQGDGLIKEYILLCHGTLPAAEGKMTDLLYKDSRKNKVFVVSRPRAGVREAALTYRVIGMAGEERTLVRVRLETGRSHQIRVQFASRRCPLWGDHKYGARDEEKNPRLFSCGLSFPWKGEYQSFEVLPSWAGRKDLGSMKE